MRTAWSQLPIRAARHFSSIGVGCNHHFVFDGLTGTREDGIGFTFQSLSGLRKSELCGVVYERKFLGATVGTDENVVNI
jgi:hypothetical protein